MVDRQPELHPVCPEAWRNDNTDSDRRNPVLERLLSVVVKARTTAPISTGVNVVPISFSRQPKLEVSFSKSFHFATFTVHCLIAFLLSLLYGPYRQSQVS